MSFISMLDITLRALEKSNSLDDRNLEWVYSKMMTFESIYDIDVFGLCQQELILECLCEYEKLNESKRVTETIDFVENYFIDDLWN